MKGYNLEQIFLTFIIYAVLGWCLEVTFHLFKSKKFINRGFLNGPLCPIYGVGAVLILLFLGNLENSFWSIFLGGAIFASLLELVTGYALEKIFKTRWWDYSGMKFNIGGYITLSFSIIWGFVSVFMMDVLQPRVNSIVMGIPERLVSPVTLFIFTIFAIDGFITIKALVSFRMVLNELYEVKNEWNSKINIIKSELADKWDNQLETFEEKLEFIKREAFEEWKAEDGDSLIDKFIGIANGIGKRQKAFLERYPSLVPDDVKAKIKKIIKDRIDEIKQ